MPELRDKPLLTLIEAGGVNDMPVIVPPADTSEVLAEAIKTVKAAGYHIRKPRKQMQRTRKRVGPTYVCEFADGAVTRMSVFTSLEKLDWERGERLSRAAYQSRWQMRARAQYRKLNGKPCPVDLIAPVPPAIISERFEQDGVVLAQRNGGDVTVGGGL